LGQEMAKNRSALGAAARAVAPVAQGLRAATRPNKNHGAGTIPALIVLAAGNGTPTRGILGLGNMPRLPDAPRRVGAPGDAGARCGRHTVPPVHNCRAPHAHAALPRRVFAEIVVMSGMRDIY